MRDPPLEPENRAERHQRQRLKLRLLLGEGLGDDPAGGGVDARVGDRVGGAALQFEVELSSLDQLYQVRHRGGREDTAELMRAFSEILVSPPAVEILRIDEMQGWPRPVYVVGEAAPGSAEPVPVLSGARHSASAPVHTGCWADASQAAVVWKQ